MSIWSLRVTTACTHVVTVMLTSIKERSTPLLLQHNSIEYGTLMNTRHSLLEHPHLSVADIFYICTLLYVHTLFVSIIQLNSMTFRHVVEQMACYELQAGRFCFLSCMVFLILEHCSHRPAEQENYSCVQIMHVNRNSYFGAFCVSTLLYYL